MQSDIVDFQRQGWKPEEIMAGLCNVLPKNIWLYVSQIPNLVGHRTQVRVAGRHAAQPGGGEVAGGFHRVALQGQGVKAEVIVHQHCGEAGAIGCAFEAVRLWENGQQTEFIGFEAWPPSLSPPRANEATRCYFCKNKCLRTFIDVKTASRRTRTTSRRSRPRFRWPTGAQRLIIATCEKGTVENVDEMRVIKGGIDAIKKENPNLVEIAAKAAFKSYEPPVVADPLPKFALTGDAEEAHRNW